MPRGSRFNMRTQNTSMKNQSTSTHTTKGRVPLRGEISRHDRWQHRIEEGYNEEVKVERNIGLIECVMALGDKRVSTREKALMRIIDAFEREVYFEDVNKNFFTLQEKFIKLIKKGSITEACRAARSLGLLVITLGYGDNAHEVMEMSILQLLEVLKAGPELLKLSVLDSLALVTFIGANDSEETQSTMKIMWQIITETCANSKPTVENKHTPAVLAKAISVWSFLLTTIDEWKINSSWKQSLDFFLSLLCHDELCVCSAAGDAIAVIFESGCLDRFSKELENFRDYSSIEISYSEEGLGYLEMLKGNILNQVQDIQDSYEEDLIFNETNFFEDLMTFLKTGCCREISVRRRKEEVVKVSTWPQLTQMNFFKNFLGHGFLKHMQENKMLHDLFEHTPEGDQHPLRDKDDHEELILNTVKCHSKKAKTQLMNRRRMFTQNKKLGHFLVAEED